MGFSDIQGQFDFHVWARSFSFTTLMASIFPSTLVLGYSLFPSLATSTAFACLSWAVCQSIYHFSLIYVCKCLRVKFGLLKGNAPRSKRLSKKQMLVWKLQALVALGGRTAVVFLGASDRADKPWRQAKVADLPTPFDFLRIMVFIVTMDGIFYTAHRLQHSNRFLYKWIHAKHHEMATPTPVSALHDSVFEKLFNCFVQVYITSCIVPLPFYHLHAAIYGIYFAEILGHSGVNVALTPPYTPLLDFFGCAISVESHDLHHRQIKSNFGKQTMLFDRIFGTYNAPVESVRKTTNTVSMSKAMEMPMDLPPKSVVL